MTLPRSFVASALLLTAAGPPAPAAEPRRLNLVSIVTDDLARWALGCYGNAEAKTPNLDRLAATGVRFTNAFTATPVCSPSRAGFLTGRYGTELGITDFISAAEHAAGVGLPENTPTWPAVLQKHGYATALVGKWHLGGRPHQHPGRNGFSHFMGSLRGSYEPTNPTLEVGGKEQKVPGFSSEVVTDEAVRFVTANRDRPFALLLHYREPHAPYAPVPKADADALRDLDPTVPDEKGLDPAHVKRLTREYYAAVHAVDRNLGRLFAALDELNLTQKTVIVFTSDHGYNIGHHGIQHKGNGHWIAGGQRGPKRPNMFDTSLRVPLLVRRPGVTRPGTTCDAAVTNLDTFASALGLLDVPVPGDVRHHGADFSPLLRGDAAAAKAWRTEFFGQYDLHNGGLAYMRMVRTADWKLVRHLRCDGLDELYDLANDPGETRNLYGRPAHRTVQKELQGKLTAWMKAINDPLRE